MKQKNTCPKCGSQDIIRVPGQHSSYGGGNNVPVGLFVFSSVLVTRYICAQCGFNEEWIDSAKDLAKLKQKYKATE
jgi:predicted nucleic-acid-binding Zn-ribbon protein